MRPPSDPHARLVEDLIAYMTMDERLGQMRALELTDGDRDQEGRVLPAVLDLISAGRVGALSGVRDTEEALLLQQTAVERSRFGTPLLIRFAQTDPVWPHVHILRATWNPALIETFGRRLAARADAHGDAFVPVPYHASQDGPDIARYRKDRMAVLDDQIFQALRRGVENDGRACLIVHSRTDSILDQARDVLVSFPAKHSDQSHSHRKWRYLSIKAPTATGQSGASSSIEASVRAILRVKANLGLLRDPFGRIQGSAGNIDWDDGLADDVWGAASILLANDNVLPLTRDAEDILVVGTHAQAAGVCNRALGAFGIAYRSISGLAMRDANVPRDAAIPSDGLAIGMACDAAHRARTVLVALDDGDCDDVPGAPAVVLKGPAQTLLRALARDHRRIVLVAASRRPVALGDLGPRIAAHLLVWSWPSDDSPSATASLGEVLTGQVAPGGRLPFPVPAIHDSPALPAGAGGSYGEVTLHEVEAVVEQRCIRVGARLVNHSEYNGAAPVQVYIQAPGKHSATPRLRAFKPIELNPGRHETVTFELGLREIGTKLPEGRYAAKPGRYRIGVGLSSIRLTICEVDLTPADLRSFAADPASDADTARTA